MRGRDKDSTPASGKHCLTPSNPFTALITAPTAAPRRPGGDPDPGLRDRPHHPARGGAHDQTSVVPGHPGCAQESVCWAGGGALSWGPLTSFCPGDDRLRVALGFAVEINGLALGDRSVLRRHSELRQSFQEERRGKHVRAQLWVKRPFPPQRGPCPQERGAATCQDPHRGGCARAERKTPNSEKEGGRGTAHAGCGQRQAENRAEGGWFRALRSGLQSGRPVSVPGSRLT